MLAILISLHLLLLVRSLFVLSVQQCIHGLIRLQPEYTHLLDKLMGLQDQ